MQRARIALLAVICASLLRAHPMGNFSVNHYARILPSPGGAQISYVMDLAEIPTFELLQKWNLDAASPQAVLQNKAVQEAQAWVRNLNLTIGGQRVEPELASTRMTLADGVGGMKVMRVELKLVAKGRPGKLEYEDRNYAGRAGWKEIVVGNGTDKSQALTAYPTDPTILQPQDLRASVDLAGAAPRVTSKAAPAASSTASSSTASSSTASRVEPPPQAPPQPAPLQEPAATAATPAQPESMGSLKRGDYLSTVLRGGDISFGVGLICLAVAFGLGAMHAFEPGHGKTMVAAYLVGSRGTPKHAVLLGLMTTFTHTISVFLLGFVTLFLSRYIMPERMSKVLGVVSGLSIVWIGGLLLYRRSRKLVSSHAPHEHAHSHSHEHNLEAVHSQHDHSRDHTHLTHSHDEGHPHENVHSHGEGDWHEHAHSHDHPHSHEHSHSDHHPHSHEHAHHDHHHHADHVHDHSHPHHHVPESDITVGSLIALGASGGLVPCPAALILLLTCISLGRPGFGMMLLLSFSIGLAIVLMSTGLVVLYAKNLIPERHRDGQSALMRALPVVSAAVIVVVGIVMTGVSLGWLPAVRFLG